MLRRKIEVCSNIGASKPARVWLMSAHKPKKTRVKHRRPSYTRPGLVRTFFV